MGRKSLDKGKRGEREAAAEIRRIFGMDANRGRQFQGGEDSPDINTDLTDVHFEVKRVESLRLYPAIEQAKQDAGSKVPVVLHRRNQKPWHRVVAMSRTAAAIPSVAISSWHNALIRMVGSPHSSKRVAMAASFCASRPPDTNWSRVTSRICPCYPPMSENPCYQLPGN